MILLSDVPTDVQELAIRRHQLASMVEIPDMRQHSDAWNMLGADFSACGYETNAEKCYKKAEHYGALAGPPPLPFTRILYCGTCGTWTRHILNVTEDFYGCGCGDGSQIEDSGIVSALSMCDVPTA